jgi:hypothetical protein
MNIVNVYIEQDKRERYICTAPFHGAFVDVKEGEILYLDNNLILVNKYGQSVTRVASNNQRAFTKKVK